MTSEEEKKFDEELIALMRQERIKVAREKIKKYFEEVIRPFFPNCELKRATPEFIEGIYVMFGTILQFEPINANLTNSQYYYDKDLEFIHYTSMTNCLNIIREQSFRMYNLHSMDDKYELKYASENQAFSFVTEEQIKKWKENVYTLSMCEIEVEENEKSFELWRNYGQNGNGAGIVFSFDKTNQQTWREYYLSKIHYSKKLIDDITNAHFDFHKKDSGYCILGDYEELLFNLCCFHKPPIYSFEQEIRLLEFDNSFKRDRNYLDFYKTLTGVDSPFFIKRGEIDAWEKYEQKTSPVIKSKTEIDFSKFSEPIRFKRLPITEKFRADLLNEINCPVISNNKDLFFPNVKIEKIILGYNYSEKDIENFKEVLAELSEKYLNYEVQCELSKLKKYFKNSA